jgi:hypothetical protein
MDSKDILGGTAEYSPSTQRLNDPLGYATDEAYIYKPSTGRLSNQVFNTLILAKHTRSTYFPPVPNPMQATNAAYATKFGAPPAAIPKIPARNNVICSNIPSESKKEHGKKQTRRTLNDRRRPMRSDKMPHVKAPRIRPTYTANATYSIRTGLSSCCTWGRTMAVPCSQRSSGGNQITESIKIAERTHCLPSILCLSVRKAGADSGRNQCCERKLDD